MDFKYNYKTKCATKKNFIVCLMILPAVYLNAQNVIVDLHLGISIQQHINILPNDTAHVSIIHITPGSSIYCAFYSSLSFSNPSKMYNGEGTFFTYKIEKNVLHINIDTKLNQALAEQPGEYLYQEIKFTIGPNRSESVSAIRFTCTHLYIHSNISSSMQPKLQNIISTNNVELDLLKQIYSELSALPPITSSAILETYLIRLKNIRHNPEPLALEILAKIWDLLNQKISAEDYFALKTKTKYTSSTREIIDGVPITNAIELQAIAKAPYGKFIIADKIDLKDTIYWNDGKGFLPIGNEKLPFSGQLLAYPNCEIYNLYINRPQECFVGMVGVAESSCLNGINLVDACVSGLNNVGLMVGAARNQTKILQCKSLGTVQGVLNVGGLIGTSSQSTSISESSAEVRVKGKYHCGGIVGINLCNSALRKCHVNGQIRGQMFIGGLTGSNQFYSTVSCSYFQGTVNGERAVGSLVGTNNEKSSVAQSYSKGKVQGEKETGLLVGTNFNSNIVQSYILLTEPLTSLFSFIGYDNKRTNHGKAFLLSKYNKQKSYEGWNFNYDWVMKEEGPVLMWQNKWNDPYDPN